jgi:hypothetical protein
LGDPCVYEKAYSPQYYDVIWNVWYQYEVSLNPSPSSLQTTAAPVGFTGALMKLGVVATNDTSFPAYPNGGSWTINDGLGVRSGVWLNGTYQQYTHSAWAENTPTWTISSDSSSSASTIAVASESYPGAGGAAWGCHYERDATDPATTSLHWLQLLKLNSWTASNYPYPDRVYDRGDGSYWVIDNVNAQTLFYDAVPGATANHTDIVDIPAWLYDDRSAWQAFTFIAWQPGGDASQTLNIAAMGVQWGFVDPKLEKKRPHP